MYRTVATIDGAISTLDFWFSNFFTREELPERSVEGRPVNALRVRAGGGGERRGVLVIGGTHARELMNPDAILELAVDLFTAYSHHNGLTYGNKTWTALEVKLILENIDLWLVPCVNPDGREYVMNTDDLWRKNRRDNPNSDCFGVDLNRNADIVWGVSQGQTSCSPCSEVYCGPSAFSEPETRNVKFLLDSRRIDCFVDVHSFSELVLYPWGHAPTQTNDPSENFTTLPTGTCSTLRSDYKEYMEPRDLQRFQTVGQRIVDAVAAVRGHVYKNETGLTLYPTTGTQSDYAYGRHIANLALRKTYGYSFETGPDVGDVRNSFHPTDPTEVKLEAKTAIIALALQCICAIELIGSRLFAAEAEMSDMRSIRDDLLGTTQPGRQWVGLFERTQLPLTAVLMEDERLLATAKKVVARIADYMSDDTLKLTAPDVELGRSMVEMLAKCPEAKEVRGELKAVVAQLERLEGCTLREAIEELMRRPPEGLKPAKSG